MSNAIQVPAVNDTQLMNKATVGYEHLFELDAYLNRMKNQKDVEILIVTILGESRELQAGRRINYLGTRNLGQDEHAELSLEKANAMVKTLSLVISATAVTFSVAAAFAGAGLAMGVCQSFAQAASQTADYSTKMTNAEVERLNHSYQLTGSRINDYYSQSQEANNTHRKDEEAIDRIKQGSQRTFEMVASNG